MEVQFLGQRSDGGGQEPAPQEYQEVGTDVDCPSSSGGASCWPTAALRLLTGNGGGTPGGRVHGLGILRSL